MAGSVPLLIRVLPSCNALNRSTSYKIFIIIFTFLCYMSYHLSRKPISIVKSVLHQKNCSVPLYPGAPVYPANSTKCDWGPFDGSNSATLLGSLDNAYLAAYAVGMFFSGHIAERMNLRYFISGGMITSGILTAAFGMGYFFNIHAFWFYIIVQIFGGVVQSTGWPSVVACMGNWYGKGKRGLIMGIWNSHTSVGNILGSLIAGVWVNHAWGWSFVVPGIIIATLGVIAFFILVTEPSIVGCEEPQQLLPDEQKEEEGKGKHVEPGETPVVVDKEEPPAAVQVKWEVPPEVKSDVPPEETNGAFMNGAVNLAFSAFEVDLTIMKAFSASDFDLSISRNASTNNLIEMERIHSGEEPVSTATQTPPVVKPIRKNESTALLVNRGGDDKAISFFKALMIPGVLEFSFCLFCAKLVSYTFLFWLPKYISVKADYDAEKAGDLSTLFDVGGILGGIAAGVISDYTGARASTCCLMLILAAPMMFIYNEFGSIDYAHSIGLLLLCGFMVNGPYALITTAVSADLGTHKSLQGSTRALATVTAIIDGTGSIGAAIGPLLTGIISPTGWNNVFWMLIAADLMAMVFLFRLVYKEIYARFWPQMTVLQVNIP